MFGSIIRGTHYDELQKQAKQSEKGEQGWMLELDLNAFLCPTQQTSNYRSYVRQIEGCGKDWTLEIDDASKNAENFLVKF